MRTQRWEVVVVIVNDDDDETETCARIEKGRLRTTAREE